MLQGKSILAIIPARGGSKGVPYKNIRIILGKPLIAWTAHEAKKSKFIDITNEIQLYTHDKIKSFVASKLEIEFCTTHTIIKIIHECVF